MKTYLCRECGDQVLKIRGATTKYLLLRHMRRCSRIDSKDCYSIDTLDDALEYFTQDMGERTYNVGVTVTPIRCYKLLEVKARSESEARKLAVEIAQNEYDEGGDHLPKMGLKYSNDDQFEPVFSSADCNEVKP